MRILSGRFTRNTEVHDLLQVPTVKEAIETQTKNIIQGQTPTSQESVSYDTPGVISYRLKRKPLGLSF